MKKTILLATIYPGFLCGCMTQNARERAATWQHYESLHKAALTITIDTPDGISEVEAFKIGMNHYATYGTACGMVSLPVDLGDSWRVTTLFGVAGIPHEDILIRKVDGVTTINKVKISNNLGR